MVHLNKKELKGMQVSRIEKEIRDTPFHKGTERHIGKLRAKLSRLRAKGQSGGKKGGGGGGGYAVKKQGDATIVLVGPPSAGKSTLLNKLTNAKSKVAPYAFTTLTVVPGMMNYHDAKLQILDVPGLIEGAEAGKGRGREVLAVVRGADLIVFMTDVERLRVFESLKEALRENGVRINEKRPNVTVEKKPSGSITLHTNVKQGLDGETIKEVARELGVKNAEITIREKLTLERAVDAFSTNRVYIPAMFVVNKMDLGDKRKKKDCLYISAENDKGLKKLREQMWKRLGLTRVYLVRRDEDPSEKAPIIVKKGTSLKQLSEKIGEEFAEGTTEAKIWGKAARFAGQTVSLSKKVEEGMKVRFV